MATESSLSEVESLLRKEPFQDYQEKVENGNYGEEYSSKTISHLKQ